MSTKGQILIVDDDQSTRLGLRRILSRAGYAVQEAASGSAALALLHQQRFDLVLTDWQMPEMDGLTFLEQLKAQGQALPVVMLTGHGTMETVVQALRRGVSDFLTKPYQPEELLVVVEREVTRYRRSLPPGVVEGLGWQLTVEQLEQLEQLLATLRADTGAQYVLVLESNGSVVVAKGALQELNVGALAALVSGSFAATAGIASLIGEEDTFKLTYHEGQSFNIYSAQIAPGLFLLIVFSHGVKLGSVMYYARSTVEQAQRLLAASQAAPPVAPSPALKTISEPEGAPAPVLASPAVTPVEEPAAPEVAASLYSLDQILQSGLLDPHLLESLDEQFAQLWQGEVFEEPLEL